MRFGDTETATAAAEKEEKEEENVKRQNEQNKTTQCRSDELKGERERATIQSHRPMKKGHNAEEISATEKEVKIERLCSRSPEQVIEQQQIKASSSLLVSERVRVYPLQSISVHFCNKQAKIMRHCEEATRQAKCLQVQRY